MYALKKEYFPNYTYDDYLLWEGDWELIDGMAYAMAPAPLIKHQAISNKIAWQLHEVLQGCEKCQALLPVDWKINDTTVVQPDNLVICHEPVSQTHIVKAPKVIFEVLSKSTATKDVNVKYALYEKEGVVYYVIVDSEDKIAKVYRLHNGKYIKVCDAYEEGLTFTLEGCQFNFDFGKIWV
jgi:Uma2 family endonuclease